MTYLASQIYRNYDGNDSTFGDTSVEASVANPDNLSAFAAVRESDGALTVMVINKQQGSTPVTVSLANFAASGSAQAWQISSASQTSIARLADLNVTNNSISTTVPSQSITLLVIPSGGAVSAPSAPAGLVATPGNGAVTLTWNAAGGATSYTVKRGTAHGGPYTAIATVASSPTSYTDSGLTNGTTYYYVVAGTNSAGASPNSAEVSATPAAPATLTFQSSAAPSPATFAPGATTTIAVSVTDIGTSGLSNSIVELQVFDKSGNAAMTTYWTGQNFTAGQTLKFSYTWNSAASLATGTYSVDIGVFDSTWAHNYYWNGSAASITIAKAQAPAAPTGLAASAGDQQVTLAWTASSGAVSYNVYRGKKPGAESATPIATGITATSFTNTGLADGKAYYYKVAAVNAAGTSAFSGEASATPHSGALSAPAALTAAAGRRKVTLAWTGSAGASSYNVYRGTAAGAESATPIATGVTSTSYIATGLTTGKPYYFKVAAAGAGGTSGLSNEASATPR